MWRRLHMLHMLYMLLSSVCARHSGSGLLGIAFLPRASVALLLQLLCCVRRVGRAAALATGRAAAAVASVARIALALSAVASLLRRLCACHMCCAGVGNANRSARAVARGVVCGVCSAQSATRGWQRTGTLSLTWCGLSDGLSHSHIDRGMACLDRLSRCHAGDTRCARALPHMSSQACMVAHAPGGCGSLELPAWLGPLYTTSCVSGRVAVLVSLLSIVRASALHVQPSARRVSAPNLRWHAEQSAEGACRRSTCGSLGAAR